MKKTILEIYALAICFISIIFLLINISEGVYNVIGIFNPELTMPSYKYEYLQSNERYRNHCCNSKGDGKKNKSDEEITKLRMENYNIELRSESRSKMQSLIRNIIYIFLSGIVLVIHWRISKSARGASI